MEGVDIVFIYMFNMLDYGVFNFNVGVNFNDNEVINVIDVFDVL